MRIDFAADAGGETAGFATGARDGPEAAGVFEDDLGVADGGVAEKEMRRRRLGEACGKTQRKKGEGS